jgi:hypothetical protein
MNDLQQLPDPNPTPNPGVKSHRPALTRFFTYNRETGLAGGRAGLETQGEMRVGRWLLEGLGETTACNITLVSMVTLSASTYHTQDLNPTE